MSSRQKASDQSQRFKDAARELGCDDDPAAFERVFAKVVPPKISKKLHSAGKKEKGCEAWSSS